MYYLYSITYDWFNFLRYHDFVFLEFIGAFIAAALVFGIYYDAINRFDGGIRQVKKCVVFNRRR